MPLIGLSRKKKTPTEATAPAGNGIPDPSAASSSTSTTYGSARYQSHPAAATPSSQPSQPPPPPPPSSSVSRTSLNICGLPVNVYGLSELTPSSSRSSAPEPPSVCVSIHVHGRGGSAETDNDVCRGVYEGARRRASQRSGAGRRSAPRELLVVSFDARNHGHRLTNQVAQQGWGKGNEKHAMDLYASILGTSADVSFLIDFLPAYLFPHDDRQITSWCITGKSMGGHCVYHILKDDPRVNVGVSMIGMPDFTRLLEFRTKQAFVRNGPPYVPTSLRALVKQRDPANAPYDRQSADNPYWGKKLMALSGADDKLVHRSFSQHFLANIVLSEPRVARNEEEEQAAHAAGGGGPGGLYQPGLFVKWYEGCKHIVTPEMIQEAGRWVGQWGLLGDE